MTFVTREELVSEQVELLPSRETLAFFNWANVSATNLAVASNTYTLFSLAAAEAYGSKASALNGIKSVKKNRIGCAPASCTPAAISGPGWMPIGPAGNLDPGSDRRAARRRLLPATQPRGRPPSITCTPRTWRICIRHAWNNPMQAAGQSFNSVCTQAFTLRGYAEVVARHLGHEPRLEFVPVDEFVTRRRLRARRHDPRAHRASTPVLDGQSPHRPRLPAEARRDRHRPRVHRRLGRRQPELTHPSAQATSAHRHSADAQGGAPASNWAVCSTSVVVRPKWRV